MCMKIEHILNNTNNSCDALLDYIICKCHYGECQLNYTQINAILKIRNFSRKILIKNIKTKEFKSITDKEVHFWLNNWMNDYQNRVIDLHISVNIN